MTTINGPDIYDILEKAGYDCDVIDDETWEDHNMEFENECEDFLKEAVEKHKHNIVSEWIMKLELKKKESKLKKHDIINLLEKLHDNFKYLSEKYPDIVDTEPLEHIKNIQNNINIIMNKKDN